MSSLPTLLHADAADALVHTAFYRFVSLPDPAAVAARLRAVFEGAEAGVLGSILVAGEGLNGMLAGTARAIEAAERVLEEDEALGGAFAGMAFKRSACVTVPFRRLKIHLKREIVPLGIDGVDATGGAGTAADVGPREWRELIRRPDVVLLDNRNSFEHRLGHFEGAIDPGVTNFRDFPTYVRAHVDEWKAAGKQVAMYCTGGIRCEKTSAWMQGMGVPVHQLQGGILNYFREMPDAALDWRGECFVFDNRVALDTTLRETPTTVDEVYADEPDGPWRLERARRLDAAGD